MFFLTFVLFFVCLVLFDSFLFSHIFFQVFVFVFVFRGDRSFIFFNLGYMQTYQSAFILFSSPSFLFCFVFPSFFPHDPESAHKNDSVKTFIREFF